MAAQSSTSSLLILPDALTPLAPSDSLGDFRDPLPLRLPSLSSTCEGLLLFAMFRSDALIPNPPSSSKRSSGSIGVGKADNGRFFKPLFLGLGGNGLTGEGDREGSFSFEAVASSTSSSSDPHASSSRARLLSERCGNVIWLLLLDSACVGR